jgi:uncharacterized protein YceK
MKNMLLTTAGMLLLSACADATRTVSVPVMRIEERGINLVDAQPSPMTPGANGCATVLDHTTTGTYERTVCFYKGARVTN